MVKSFTKSSDPVLGDSPRSSDGQTSHESLPADTPVKPRDTSTLVCSLGSLDQSRSAVFKDLAAIPIVENAVFEKFLPRWKPAALPAKVDAHIKESKELKGWAHFSNEPKRIEGRETDIFKAFSRLIQDIIRATTILARNTPPTCSHSHNPDFTPYSTTRDNTSKPDGYLVFEPTIHVKTRTVDLYRPYAMLRHIAEHHKDINKPCQCGGDGINWEDIGAPFELKPKDNVKAKTDVRESSPARYNPS
jgi:hypothetical protein